MLIVRLNTEQITDWASFHLVCKEAFDFPDYYGENMNAWIDCMSDLVIGEKTVQIEITNTENFKSRQSEIFDALVECSAFVNNRFMESAEISKIAIIFL